MSKFLFKLFFDAPYKKHDNQFWKAFWLKKAKEVGSVFMWVGSVFMWVGIVAVIYFFMFFLPSGLATRQIQLFQKYESGTVETNVVIHNATNVVASIMVSGNNKQYNEELMNALKLRIAVNSETKAPKLKSDWAIGTFSAQMADQTEMDEWIFRDIHGGKIKNYKFYYRDVEFSIPEWKETFTKPKYSIRVLQWNEIESPATTMTIANFICSLIYAGLLLIWFLLKLWFTNNYNKMTARKKK